VSVEVRGWLSHRRPPPPEAMSSWLEVDADGTAPLGESLAEMGIEALDRARALPGRVRESAYYLLRADALLTYACEAAVESADPQRALRWILRSVGAHGR